MITHLFVSDLHASLRLPHAKANASGTSSDRLADVITVLDEIADSTTPDTVVWILGDLFHERSPDAPTLKLTSRALRNIADAACEVFILPGNHDAHGRNAAVYSLSLFNELGVPGIRVIEEPMWVDGKFRLGVDGEENDAEFFAVPWIPESEFPDVMALAEETAPGRDLARVLLMHQTVTGAMSNGRRLSGVSAGCITSRVGPEGEPLFDRILSGHIHMPQRFAGGLGVYLGSPIPMSFGEDDGKARGFYVGCELDGVWDVGQVELDSPKFVRWAFDSQDEDSVTDVFDELREDFEDEITALLNEGPLYLDVKVCGPREEIDPIAMAVSQFLQTAEIDHAPKLRMWRLSRIATDAGADRVEAASKGYSPQEMIDLYVEANKATLPDGIDAESLQDLGRSLLP